MIWIGIGWLVSAAVFLELAVHAPLFDEGEEM